ncbi:MAG TPA: RNA polymerase sigma factor [Polyangia bacterium]|nr:RNA polymerase sigma factor [Polyangia bacterium]
MRLRDDSDESLMLRYRDGDVRAFEVLVTRHRKPIYNFILRFVRDTAQAEDVLQETFLRLIKGADAYERQAKFTTWLYTIARNLCVDASRRGKHRNAASLDAPVNGEEGASALIDLVADGKSGVDREAIGRELAVRIKQAVESLPDEQREIFLLREVSDLQFNEIAKIVGCPENTVKSRMRYALEKLREALEEYRDLAQAVQ